MGQLFAWPDSNTMVVCTTTGSIPKWQNSSWPHIVFLSITIICFVLIVISYVVLTVSIHYQYIQSTIGKSEMLTLRTLFLIAMVYVLSNITPYFAYLAPKPETAMGFKLGMHFFRSFLYVQSALNPVIYYNTNTAYKAYIRGLLKSNKVGTDIAVN